MSANRSRNAVPTLEDVARRAGVSTATVSRCLNNPDVVAEATREAVLAAVRALRYSPNYSARALAARRTDTYGAVIPTMDNAIFARGLEAFQQALSRHGATLLVASSGYDRKRETRQIENLAARGIEGILLIGRARDAGVYHFLHERSIAAVLAWTACRDDDCSTIGFDNAKGAATLALHALGLGHRRLACIAAHLRDNDRAAERVAGIRGVMPNAGLDPGELDLIETNYSVRCGSEAMQTLMGLASRPTMVFCGNDVLAVGALQAARDLGIRVPDEVSISGFDDIEIAGVTTPGITTMHVPHRKMGALAAETLIAEARGELDQPTCIELPTTLVERGSMGPAPG